MSAAVKWHEGPMVGFDTETTGVDVFNDRIVTASVVYAKPGERPRPIEWIIDPGMDIPAEAAAVHGWTNEQVLEVVGGQGVAVRRTPGSSMRMTRDAALGEIAGHLGMAMGQEVPVVAANAAYDFSLLEAELARNGVDTLASRPAGVRGVVDPMVLDKQYDTYRKTCYKAPGCNVETKVHECSGCQGSRRGYDCGGCGATDRTLTGLAQHYGFVLTGAHSSSADAIAAMRVAKRFGSLWPEVARYKLGTLHEKQRAWHFDHMEGPKGLKVWFQREGLAERAASVCGEWPLHSRCVGVKAVA